MGTGLGTFAGSLWPGRGARTGEGDAATDPRRFRDELLRACVRMRVRACVRVRARACACATRLLKKLFLSPASIGVSVARQRMRSDFRPWLSCASGGATLPTSGDAAPEPPNPRTGARGAGDRESRRSGRRGAWRQASRVARGGDLCPQEPEQQRGFVVSLHVSVIGRTLRRSSRVNKRCPRTPEVSSLLRLFEARSRLAGRFWHRKGGLQTPRVLPGHPRHPRTVDVEGGASRCPGDQCCGIKGQRCKQPLNLVLKMGLPIFCLQNFGGVLSSFKLMTRVLKSILLVSHPATVGVGGSALRAKQMTGTRPLPGEQEPPPNTGKRTLQEKDFISLVSNFIHLLAT